MNEGSKQKQTVQRVEIEGKLRGRKRKTERIKEERQTESKSECWMRERR